MANRPEPRVRVKCEILGETAKSLLVKVKLDGQIPATAYVPMACIHEIHKAVPMSGQPSYVVMDEWIAKKERLVAT